MMKTKEMFELILDSIRNSMEKALYEQRDSQKVMKLMSIEKALSKGLAVVEILDIEKLKDKESAKNEIY